MSLPSPPVPHKSINSSPIKKLKLAAKLNVGLGQLLNGKFQNIEKLDLSNSEFLESGFLKAFLQLKDPKVRVLSNNAHAAHNAAPNAVTGAPATSNAHDVGNTNPATNVALNAHAATAPALNEESEFQELKTTSF